MSIEVFSINAKGDSVASEGLNQFLRSHRILSVERRLIEDGGQSFWTFAIDFMEEERKAGNNPRKSSVKVDYREILQPDEFDRYLQLRALRKDIAEQQAIPHFTIFTNEQLAGLARLKELTKTSMQGIPGVGEAKTKQYGELFLNLLSGDTKTISTDETSGASD
jgi:superfamily II DNA helicase RecQ